VRAGQVGRGSAGHAHNAEQLQTER
jgi:hypothetical protein